MVALATTPFSCRIKEEREEERQRGEEREKRWRNRMKRIDLKSLLCPCEKTRPWCESKEEACVYISESDSRRLLNVNGETIRRIARWTNLPCALLDLRPLRTHACSKMLKNYYNAQKMDVYLYPIRLRKCICYITICYITILFGQFDSLICDHVSAN